jgi:hypothetical protein
VYQDNIPLPHLDPWIELTREYVTGVVRALSAGGLRVERSWLDPCDPRDATIVYSFPEVAGERALVWDEITGWRQGRLESGHRGVRTELSDAIYLGGGVLPGGTELAGRLLDRVAEPYRAYRSVADLRDGLDEALARRFGSSPSSH